VLVVQWPFSVPQWQNLRGYLPEQWSRNMCLTISKTTLRRFVLGQQGLYPGRRWQGKEGVAKAILEGSVVQVDPLNVVARNHDIVLYGRVLQGLRRFMTFLEAETIEMEGVGSSELRDLVSEQL
jgi:hypothetical protein